MIAAASQWLDEERPGALQSTIGEIADLKLVIDSLFARPDFHPMANEKLQDRYERLRARLDAGEFSGDK